MSVRPDGVGAQPETAADPDRPTPAYSTTAERVSGRSARLVAASVGGWAMDGFDMIVFSVVAAPALTALLASSGMSSSQTSVGTWAEISAAVFLAGWGFSFVWGPIADRYGRRRAMIGTILVFAVFTAGAGLSHNVWMFVACRFFAAIGVGGEWALAGTVVAEAVPERIRARMGGLLHAGVYVGALVVSVVYLTAGGILGWRGMFFLGLIPAALVFLLRAGLGEPERYDQAADRGEIVPAGQAGVWEPLREILSPRYRRQSMANLAALVVCVMGLWAGSSFAATAISQIAQNTGRTDARTLMSLVTFTITLFTILGCVCVPWLANRLGRRGALALLFVFMLIGILGSYTIAYPHNSVAGFFVFAPILGFGGANFAVFTLWLPEQYPTRIRATAFAFSTTISRWAAAALTFVIAWGISATGSLTIPLALTAAPFVIGLFLVRLIPETRGQTLPQ